MPKRSHTERRQTLRRRPAHADADDEINRHWSTAVCKVPGKVYLPLRAPLVSCRKPASFLLNNVTNFDARNVTTRGLSWEGEMGTVWKVMFQLFRIDNLKSPA